MSARTVARSLSLAIRFAFYRAVVRVLDRKRWDQ